MRPATILVPTDFTDASLHAFQVAAQLARASGARLVVVHVSDSIIPYVGEEAGVFDPDQLALRHRFQEYSPPEDWPGA